LVEAGTSTRYAPKFCPQRLKVNLSEKVSHRRQKLFWAREAVVDGPTSCKCEKECGRRQKLFWAREAVVDGQSLCERHKQCGRRRKLFLVEAGTTYAPKFCPQRLKVHLSEKVSRRWQKLLWAREAVVVDSQTLC
jgi:hypothetical protein